MIRRNITVRKCSTKKSEAMEFDRVKVIRATQTFGLYEIKFVPVCKGFVVKKKDLDNETDSVKWIVGEGSVEIKYLSALKAASGLDSPNMDKEMFEVAAAQKLLIIHDEYSTNLVDLHAIMDFIKRGIVY
jgi:hypothetical protein